MPPVFNGVSIHRSLNQPPAHELIYRPRPPSLIIQFPSKKGKNVGSLCAVHYIQAKSDSRDVRALLLAARWRRRASPRRSHLSPSLGQCQRLGRRPCAIPTTAGAGSSCARRCRQWPRRRTDQLLRLRRARLFGNLTRAALDEAEQPPVGCIDQAGMACASITTLIPFPFDGEKKKGRKKERTRLTAQRRDLFNRRRAIARICNCKPLSSPRSNRSVRTKKTSSIQ